MFTRTMLIASLLLPISALATEPAKKDRPEISSETGERKSIRDSERDSLVREIHLKDLGRDDLSQDLTRGGFDKPTVIDSDAELTKIFKDKAVENRLDREVDFNMSSCIRIVDKDVGSSGTSNAQYFTALFTLKNVCRSGTYNVTFDVPFAGDPKCQRFAPGKTAEFVWGYNPNATFAYRRIKEC